MIRVGEPVVRTVWISQEGAKWLIQTQLLRRDGMEGLVPECKVSRCRLLNGKVARARARGSREHVWINMAAVAQKDVPNTVNLLEFPDPVQPAELLQSEDE